MKPSILPARVKVLKVFFEQPDKELYVMEIKKRIGLSYDRVYQYLKDLENEGILTSELKGKLRFYRANLKNKMTLKLFETFEVQKREDVFEKDADMKALLERFVEDVLKQLKDKVLIIILFGSVARGKYDKDSDVDILIVTSNLSNIKSIKGIINKAAREYSSIYGRDIVPITITLKEFSEGLKTKRDFFQELWIDRIALYGESRFFEEIAEIGVPVE